MITQRHNNCKGFTLVELLVALMVTSIILAAVATLAFAMSSVKTSTDDTSYKEAHLRYATLRLTDLIRNCRLVCAAVGNDTAIWKSDDNGDGKINAAELVYIEAGSDRQYIKLLEFTSAGGPSIELSEIVNDSARQTLLSSGNYRRITLVPSCSNVQFLFDNTPPLSRFMNISFDIVENGASRQWQINSRLRGWAGNLLNSSASAIVSDDD